PAIKHTSATLVSTCISPPPMALYSDKTESGKYFRLVSLAVQVRPIARLNETGPIVGMLAVLTLQHRQLPPTQCLAPSEPVWSRNSPQPAWLGTTANLGSIGALYNLTMDPLWSKYLNVLRNQGLL